MRKLLLVEDSPTQAALMRSHFEQAGLNVLVAGDGEEGLNKTASFCPDLVLLDMQLPDINGIEVCKRLKAQIQTRAIPVVMLSSNDTFKSMVDAYKAGADYYVVKDENSARTLELLIETTLIQSSRIQLKIPVTFNSLTV